MRNLISMLVVSSARKLFPQHFQRGSNVFYRAMLCIRGILAMGLCPYVRLCLSKVGVLSKRMNESSWFLACELPSTRPTLC